MVSRRLAHVELNPVVAAEVAAAHQAASSIGGPVSRAAYAQLVKESDRLFRCITQCRQPIRIAFTMCPTPYDDARELLTSIRRDGFLEVSAARCEGDRLHPVMGCEVGGAYDRFRAVHDVLGHGQLDVGFDRAG